MLEVCNAKRFMRALSMTRGLLADGLLQVSARSYLARKGMHADASALHMTWKVSRNKDWAMPSSEEQSWSGASQSRACMPLRIWLSGSSNHLLPHCHAHINHYIATHAIPAASAASCGGHC